MTTAPNVSPVTEEATEAQYDAAYAAYHSAVDRWQSRDMGGRFLVIKRFLEPTSEPVNADDVGSWVFDDKATRDRFLISKLLAEITEAVVAAALPRTERDEAMRKALEECHNYMLSGVLEPVSFKRHQEMLAIIAAALAGTP